MSSFPTRAVLSVCLVFSSGVLLGALGHRYFALKEVSAGPPQRRSMDDMRKMYLQEMKDKLNLNSKQLEDLKVVLDETGTKYRNIREKYRPEMQAIQDEQVTRINAMLNPEQQSAYEQLRKEREERKKKQDRDK
jgi:hypothetical protein